MDLTGISLMSSNEDKLREYASFGISNLSILKGIDLDEVLGTPDEVIAYKSVAAGTDTLVEDSILIVDGEVLVDARWRLGEIDQWCGKPGIWEVRLGLNSGGTVSVFKGSVSGIFCPAAGSGFGFDSYFLVPEEGKTLAQLANEGRKDEYSARRRAASNLIMSVIDHDFAIGKLLPWSGAFQH